MSIWYWYKTVSCIVLWQRLFFLEWTTFRTFTIYTNTSGVRGRGQETNNLESPQSHFKLGENIITSPDHPWTYSFETIFFCYKEDTIKWPSLFSYYRGKCCHLILWSIKCQHFQKRIFRIQTKIPCCTVFDDYF